MLGKRSETELRVLRLMLSVNFNLSLDELFHGLQATKIHERNQIIEAVEKLHKERVLYKRSRRYQISDRSWLEPPSKVIVEDRLTFYPNSQGTPEQKILSVLGLVGGYMTSNEIAKRTGLSSKRTAEALKKLEKQKYIYGVGNRTKRYTTAGVKHETASVLSTEKWVSLSVHGVGNTSVENVLKLLTDAGITVHLNSNETGNIANVAVTNTKIIELQVIKGEKHTPSRTKVKAKANGEAKAKGRSKKRGGGGGTPVPGREVNFRDPLKRAAFAATIERIVATCDGQISSTQIQDEVGGSSNQVREILDQLREQGKVERNGKARATRYRWVGL